jgi:hypothetical protein
MLLTSFIETNNICQLKSKFTRITNSCTFAISRDVMDDKSQEIIRELAPLATIIDIITSKIIPSKVPDLKGKTIKTAVFGNPPFMYKENQEFVGIDVEIAKILAEKYQFNLQISQVKGWGNRLENGSWDGVVGEVTIPTLIQNSFARYSQSCFHAPTS